MTRFVSAFGRLPPWIWLSVCLIGLIVALGGNLRPAPVDRGFRNANLSSANTEAQVVAVLGPPGDYSTREQALMAFHSGPPPSGRPVEWRDDYARVVVYFTPDGYLTYWNVFRPIPDNRSWVQRVLDLRY